MKHIHIIIGLILCVACRPGHQAELRGTIGNYNGELVRIAARDGDKRDTLHVDEKGNFMYHPRTNGDNRVYELTVKNYRQKIPVYLAQGDREKLQLTLQPEQSIQTVFSGERASENEYLATLYAIENSREWYLPEFSALSFKEFKAIVDKKDTLLRQFAGKIRDAEARQLLEEQACISLQRRRVSWYWFDILEDTTRQIHPDTDFSDFVKTLDLNNPRSSDEKLMEEVVGWYISRDTNRDWDYHYKRRLQILGELVTSTELRNRYATHLFRGYFIQDAADLREAFELYNSLCTDEILKAEVAEEYREYVRVNARLTKGSLAPDFEFAGIDGKKYRLSDFRGKFLFVDLWATWCAPCLEEIPYMASLHEHFANDNRIEIISVALDNKTKAWRNFLEKEKPMWKQYIVDQENDDFLEKEYRIRGIPHFMLLDPEGRFVSYAFYRPSDARCLEALEKYLSGTKN